MKVLFFIAAKGHGSGGHYHSLNHISRELGKGHEVRIISIGSGRGFSNIIGENPYFMYQYKFKGINILQLFKKIDKTINSFKPDIINFFDLSSYNVLRLHISSKKYKVFLTKCGGPNREWPYVNNLVLFSQENNEWYKNNPKFRLANIFLIPYRIQQLQLNESYKPVFKDPDSFNFVRICRIQEGYKKSIRDSINLIKYLHAKGHSNVKLYVIGVIEDNNVYNELTNEVAEMGDSVSFHTSTHITKEASMMLYLADAVIGTGRGFMESASLGKPLLAINAEDNYPVLINQHNFFDVFKTNFSQRNIIASYNSEENLNNIKKIILEKEYYGQLSKFSISLFQEYFNVGKAFKAYTDAFENARFGPNGYLQDLIMILKNLYHFTVDPLKGL